MMAKATILGYRPGPSPPGSSKPCAPGHASGASCSGTQERRPRPDSTANPSPAAQRPGPDAPVQGRPEWPEHSPEDAFAH